MNFPLPDKVESLRFINARILRGLPKGFVVRERDEAAGLVSIDFGIARDGTLSADAG